VYSPLDWSQALLLAMAVGTLVGGSLWAAADEQAVVDKQRKAPDSADGGSSTGDVTEPLAPAALRQVPQLRRLFVDAWQPEKPLRCHASSCAHSAEAAHYLQIHTCHMCWQFLHQDSISPRLRRCTAEERGSDGAVAASAGQPQTAAHAHSSGGAPDADVMYVTAWGAVAYLFIASAVLVALFFMLDYINALIVRTPDQPLPHQPRCSTRTSADIRFVCLPASPAPYLQQ
jgi:hypothetical protein